MLQLPNWVVALLVLVEILIGDSKGEVVEHQALPNHWGFEWADSYSLVVSVQQLNLE